MIVKTETLRHALEVVKPGLANKERIEQTTSFAFLQGRVVTYNDEISISHPVVGLDLEGVVPAEHLYKFLEKVKKEEVDIEVVGNELIVKSGKSKAGFALEREIRLPLKQELWNAEDWHALPENFSRAVSFASKTCSNDVSRPKLTCVHLSKEGFVEASDGYRLLRYSLGTGFIESILVPSTSCEEVVGLSMKEYRVEKGWVHFRNEERTILSSRVLEEDYVDITPHLNVEGEKVILPRTILEALDRVHVFAKRRRVIDESVEVESVNRRLILRASSDGSWVEEEINFAYDGAGFKFVVVPSLLKDVLTESLECVVSQNRLKFRGEGWEYVVALKERRKAS